MTIFNPDDIIKTTKGKATNHKGEKKMTIATLEIITAIVMPVVSLNGILTGAKLNKPVMVIGNVALALLTAALLRAI